MRLIPLVLPLFALPWLVAAPVPKGPPPFGPVLTADQLATLPFVDADPRTKDGESSEARNARSVAVAIHLPRTRYEEGDPIPALFAVKNRADKPHGLWMRLDFASRTSHGATGMEVRNTATDTRSSPFSGQSTMCGGPRGEIPGKGYFAVRGDVGRLADGKPRPVGEYELRWTYAGVQSNAVTFSVIGRRLGRPDPEPLRRLSLWRLEPGEAGALAPVAEADFAHAFQTGEFGAHFPDVSEIPAERGGLAVSAKWDGDTVTVTVTLDSPHREFTELGGSTSVVYLMLERAGVAADAEARAAEKSGERKDSAAEAQKLPLKLAIRLPDGWRDKAGVSGECRVAVVVASREPPERACGERRQHRIVEGVKVAKMEGRKTKTGDWVLKTEWQPLPNAPSK